MFNSQVELEQQMLDAGKERASRLMESNEEGGRTAHNPYAKVIFKRFVLPLSEIIEKDLVGGGAGRAKAHVKFLRALEPQATAYIAVRTLLTTLMSDMQVGNGRILFHKVGKEIQSEQVLRQFQHLDQEAYFHLQNELKRKHSQDLRHKMTLVSRHFKEKDLSPIDWGKGSRDQVGVYLVSALQDLDMVEIDSTTVNKKHIWTVSLSESVMDLIKETKEFIEEMTPFHMPCIEQPKDWISVHDGGYHTPGMRKLVNSAISKGNSGGNPAQILEAINTLQRVKWQVNVRVLEVAKELSKFVETEEIVSTSDIDKPERPEFLGYKEKEDLNEQEKVEFKKWKRNMSEFYTQVLLKKQSYSRMFNVFRIADKFKDELELFFVYSADFRGRLYPFTSGVNPQGSDLQKGVLTFKDGKALRTKESIEWFMIHGANKFGIDKAPFAERLKWVRDNEQMILAIADDPVGNYKQWAVKGSADKPFQFLAWAFEYAEFIRYGAAFVSRIPISMDGSCNGLQNFSACLRDEVGGKATNLIDCLIPEDIYTMVAEVTLEKLKAMEEDKDGFRSRWIKHGIKRGLVKRSVMTLPYGSTRFSCRNFILDDYIKVEKPEEFDKDEYSKAATFLANIVWDSIGNVVVKAREAMEWLQTCSNIIMKEGYKDIKWTTPTGLTVSQVYNEIEENGKINIQIYGGARLRLSATTDKPDKNRHKNGIAPNFVHSLDAAHMHKVVLRSKKEGYNSLAMIHDDFGTLAADAPHFNKIIREEFVKMYMQDDWLLRFAQSYIDAGVPLPLPPSHGKLDLNLTLDSKYFFA